MLYTCIYSACTIRNRSGTKQIFALENRVVSRGEYGSTKLCLIFAALLRSFRFSASLTSRRCTHEFRETHFLPTDSTTNQLCVTRSSTFHVFKYFSVISRGVWLLLVDFRRLYLFFDKCSIFKVYHVVHIIFQPFVSLMLIVFLGLWLHRLDIIIFHRLDIIVFHRLDIVIRGGKVLQIPPVRREPVAYFQQMQTKRSKPTTTPWFVLYLFVIN